MADVDVTQELPIPVERPRPVTAGPLAWLRANLFNSIPNTILTIAALYLLAVIIPPVVRWALVDAVWHGRDRPRLPRPAAPAGPSSRKRAALSCLAASLTQSIGGRSLPS